MIEASALISKWKDVLDHEKFSPIKNSYKRGIMAHMLENTEADSRAAASFNTRNFLTEAGVPVNAMGASSSDPSTGNIDTFDPILISMVRRTMPNLVAYDIMGVQPMTGPTGLIFAMRSRYTNQTGPENFYNEVNTAFSSVTAGNTTLGQANGNIGGADSSVNGGFTSGTVVSGNSSTFNFAGGMSTAQAEALGATGNVDFAEMSLSVEKVTVEAKSRALKARYTMELAQDLKALHGLDAETELSNILSSEIMAEINREAIRTVVLTASTGVTNGTTAGTFDLDADSNGRWSVEKYKGLLVQLGFEANAIAKTTRRGKGNIILCSSDVATALNAAGLLDYAPALNTAEMNPDDTGNTFVGVLNGQYKVYIDPYSGGNYAVVGFKGANPYDAGLFYCPYVPLQMVRAVDPDSFQPAIGFKTRYGMVANPYAGGLAVQNGVLTQNSNVYYRRFLVTNLL